MQIPRDYVTKEVSNYNSTLADATTKTCNEMLAAGYIYVGTIAHVEQLSAILLFAEY